MKHLYVLLACIALHYTSTAQITLEETTVDTQTVISGLDTPWEIVWGPDDHLWITERFGRISRIHPGTGMQTVLLDLSQTVTQQGESGMLGLALHPDFPADNRLYVVYTYLNGNAIVERLVAYEYANNTLSNPDILIDDITGNTTHDGSRLLFGADGKLYMTTGDAQDQPSAQDPNDLNGKLLRINPDGSVPSDNPIPGSYVYSLGHRNAQGLCSGPGNRLFSSEHGPSTDDELNLIEAGGNYGWPNVHGFCDLPSEQTFCNDNDVVEPLYAWTPTVAASDIEYYNHDAIPELKGALLMLTLKEKDMRVMHLDSDSVSISSTDTYFDQIFDRLRAICVAPDGSIYISNSRGNWGGSTAFTHQIIHIFNPNAQGFNDPSMEDDWQPYPNPFSSELQLADEEIASTTTFTARSIQGEVLFHGNEEATTHYLTASTTPSGFYIIEVEFDAQWRKRLLIKQD